MSQIGQGPVWSAAPAITWRTTSLKMYYASISWHTMSFKELIGLEAGLDSLVKTRFEEVPAL